MFSRYIHNKSKYNNLVIPKYGGYRLGSGSGTGSGLNNTYHTIINKLKFLNLKCIPPPCEPFDIDYTKTEIETLSKIDIRITDSYNFFGYMNPNDSNLPNLSEFINKIGNNVLINESLTKIINKILSSVIIGAGNKDHVWFLMRASTPDDYFNIQRWHVDGKFYIADDPYELFQYKFVTILKGAGTYCLNLNPDEKKIFLSKLRSQQYADDYEQNRKDLHEMYEKYNKTQLSNNQGLLLINSKNDEYCTVHSEPPKTENRLFLSILTGTDLEMKRRYDEVLGHPNGSKIGSWHSK
jgi:hypothetical protein